MAEIHDKAVAAALNAAFAVAEDEGWFFGGLTPSNKARKAFAERRAVWLLFARENKTAPAEALWIRGGALGFHRAKVAYAALPRMIRLAFETFHRVLNDVSDALDEHERAQGLRLEAERRAAEIAARPKLPPDLEGTPLELFPDPLGPSEFAPAKVAPATKEAADGAP